MNRDAIERACTWARPDEAELVVPSPLFLKDIKLQIFTLRDGIITDAQIAAVNDVISLPRNDFDNLATMLWHDALFSFETVDYGIDPTEGESLLDAVQRDFAIHGPSDAIAKSTLRCARVTDDSEHQFVHRYSKLLIECPWAGLNDAIIRDGRLIDVYQNGAFCGWYEPGGRYADESSHVSRGRLR